jgi:ATP-dependent exoDNAse (exonuclease V) beta subunit
MSLVRSKGLEFEDCALVNVFGTASLPKALQDAWLQLLDLMASEETLSALVSKKKLQEQAAMLRLPRIFERELKQLYVALTRDPHSYKPQRRTEKGASTAQKVTPPVNGLLRWTPAR